MKKFFRVYLDSLLLPWPCLRQLFQISKVFQGIIGTVSVIKTILTIFKYAVSLVNCIVQFLCQLGRVQKIIPDADAISLTDPGPRLHNTGTKDI